MISQIDLLSLRTLVLIRRPGELLLGQKKRGFGEGRWNGFGGKLQSGETIAQAAVREVEEECSLRVSNLVQCGQLGFTFAHDPLVLNVHIFTTRTYRGEPHETEEMKPQWYPETQLPLKDMWTDDQHWLPLFLAGKAFSGEFHFADWNTINHFNLNEVAPGHEPWHTTTMVQRDGIVNG